MDQTSAENTPGVSSGSPVTIKIRYFAGAQAAAGIETETLAAGPGVTVAELTRLLADRHGAALARVLSAASVLVNEVAAGPETILTDGAEVDVLPPFAGG